MTIGIDGNEANVEQQVGVSVYTRNILEFFAKKADKNTQFIVYLRNAPLKTMPASNEFYRYEVVKGPMFWSQVLLPLRLYTKREIDVFFSPAHYSPRFCPVPLVVTIHDVAYFYYPNEFLKKDLYKLTNWTKQSVEKARRIIAVSKNTKKDILKFYDVANDKVEIVYNGFEKAVDQDEKSTILKKLNLKAANYLLYVGTLQPRKNIVTLLEAFAKIKDVYDYQLVLVGKKGWMYDEIFQKTKALGIDSRVTFTGYVENDDLEELYEEAFCYILPSLYEGFGIPVLEAMAHGCPVITSFASSLPEIGGEACMYFDPTSAENLAEKIKILTENKTIRKELIAKGKQRVKDFSWEKCATQTLEVLKQSAAYGA